MVLRETVRIARKAGLAKLGRVAIDGTKIRANASRDQAMRRGRRDEAEAGRYEEIRQSLAQIAETNDGEDGEPGDRDGGGGPPDELRLREPRRERIRQAHEQLESEEGEAPKAQHGKSLADLEANLMKTGEGALTSCYDAQAATSEDGIVVASGISTGPNDAPLLVSMVEAVQQDTTEGPGTALADTGYLGEANLVALRRRRQRCLVAVGREAKKPPRWPKGPLTQRMHRMLRLPWARELYSHRKTQGERPFAEIQQRMKFRRFSLRGKPKVRGGWNLVCAALNLLTITRLREARGASSGSTSRLRAVAAA